MYIKTLHAWRFHRPHRRLRLEQKRPVGHVRHGRRQPVTNLPSCTQARRANSEERQPWRGLRLISQPVTLFYTNDDSIVGRVVQTAIPISHCSPFTNTTTLLAQRNLTSSLFPLQTSVTYHLERISHASLSKNRNESVFGVWCYSGWVA